MGNKLVKLHKNLIDLCLLRVMSLRIVISKCMKLFMIINLFMDM